MMDVTESLKFIPGTPLPLGKRVYICPALNIKTLRALKKEIDLIQGGMAMSELHDADSKAEEYLTAVIRVTAAALVRNYPDITEEFVEEGLDLNHLKTVALTVLGASGFRTVTQEEAEKAIAGASAGEQTGTA